MASKRTCAQCAAVLSKSMRCGQCKAVWYCDRACQKQHWSSHKAECKVFALALLMPSPLTTAAPFVEAANIPTRGAAGWAHFIIDGQDYVAVANFFTSSPCKQPRMETESTVYKAVISNTGQLQLTELQRFKMIGAHGVVHCEHHRQHYLSVPNYVMDTV